jgi:voltage-gated potassium channel
MTLHERLAEITPYQLFVLVLSIFSLSLLAADVLMPIDENTRIILQHGDNVVCALFLWDFIHSLAKAPDRLRYLVTWGWIDLLSSIPALDAFRWGRAARVLRILRVLRAVRSVRVMAQFVAAKRAQSAGLAALLMTVLLVIFSSIAVLQFEAPAGGNIQSAEDAMWWSVTTMTTVGYGDRYPITSEGRLIAVVLMAAGVGVFGTLSGLVAGWFLAPASKAADNERAELLQLMAQLKDQLAAN